MMTAAKLVTLLVLTLAPLGSGTAAAVDETPVEIVVTGRVPGPPLWKVTNGENVLWIFPYLSRIPRDIIWDSDRVARVIAQSQEFIGLPESRAGPAPSVLVNPISIARGHRLNGRLERNPDGGTLEDNLPPELYARFASLKEHYFPADDSLLELRPQAAAWKIADIIRMPVGLVSGNELLQEIRTLVRRNRAIRNTEIFARGSIGKNYREWEDRFEALHASFSPELERACFEQVVRHVEEDLDAMRSRANRWAQGDIDNSREVLLVFDTWDRTAVCADLYMGNSSPIQKILLDMITARDQMWLDAAEKALATNASTFAILPVNELFAEDGLLSKLKAKGYDVRAP